MNNDYDGGFSFYIDGNNGGDYIKIAANSDDIAKGTMTLEVGHCCVVIMKHKVPIEFITTLIDEFWETEETLRDYLKKTWGKESYKKLGFHNKIRKLK